MKKVLALVLAMMLVLSVSAAFAEKAGEGMTIGVVYKQSGNPYFQAGVTGFEKAAEELGWADVSAMLVGPTAVVTAKGDASELAKIVCKFVKDHAKAAVKGGELDKAALSPADVDALSKLPSKDQLRAQLLATFMAPATNLVRIFVAPAQSVLYALKAKEEKDGGAPAEA